MGGECVTGVMTLKLMSVALPAPLDLILGCYGAAANGPDIGKFTLTLKKDATRRWLIFSDMDNPIRKR